MKCNVCGFGFEATKERHYIARDTSKLGLAALSGEEAILFDAFDCPYCGCQIISQERKRKVDKNLEVISDAEN